MVHSGRSAAVPELLPGLWAVECWMLVVSTITYLTTTVGLRLGLAADRGIRWVWCSRFCLHVHTLLEVSTSRTIHARLPGSPKAVTVRRARRTRLQSRTDKPTDESLSGTRTIQPILLVRSLMLTLALSTSHPSHSSAPTLGVCTFHPPRIRRTPARRLSSTPRMSQTRRQTLQF